MNIKDIQRRDQDWFQIHVVHVEFIERQRNLFFQHSFLHNDLKIYKSKTNADLYVFNNANQYRIINYLQL